MLGLMRHEQQWQCVYSTVTARIRPRGQRGPQVHHRRVPEQLHNLEDKQKR
jgi:hypothetical protein